VLTQGARQRETRRGGCHPAGEQRTGRRPERSKILARGKGKLSAQILTH
jgi:hypothetical protein